MWTLATQVTAPEVRQNGLVSALLSFSSASSCCVYFSKLHFFLLKFLSQGSLSSSDWTETRGNTPASASKALGFQVPVTTPGCVFIYFLKKFLSHSELCFLPCKRGLIIITPSSGGEKVGKHSVPVSAQRVCSVIQLNHLLPGSIWLCTRILNFFFFPFLGNELFSVIPITDEVIHNMEKMSPGCQYPLLSLRGF